MDWLDYQFMPRLGAGLGLGGGYVDVSQGGSMAYEQGQGRVIWQATDKMGLSVSGGFEDRQFVNSTQSALVNPIFTTFQVFTNHSRIPCFPWTPPAW